MTILPGSALATASLLAASWLGAAGPLASAPQSAAIVWSADRLLTWDDFEAKPIRDLDGARSAISHEITVGCRSGVLTARIQTVFWPDQSSVTYRIVSSGLPSRMALQHEQTHFDIAEVYARRIRRMFAELADPCPRSDAELNAMVDRWLAELSKEQQRYDDQSRFGELEGVQIKWAQRVAAELAELARFADPGR